MTTSYYDVVLLGTQPSILLCAALLARRGFRVLILGQGVPSADYEIGGHRLPRSTHAMLAAHSPSARKVLSELALSQLIRRRTKETEPALQIALPGHRFDLALDGARFEREVEREFPTARRLVEEHGRALLAFNERFDALVEADLVWPPETFFERRQFAQSSAHIDFDRDGMAPDPLESFAEDHPFRVGLSLPHRMSDYMDPDHPSVLRRQRHLAAWLRGPTVLEHGYRSMFEMVVDRIQAHGGEIRLAERADRILVKRQAATGVRLRGTGDEIGCAYVVVGTDVSALGRLLPERRPLEELYEKVGEPQPRYYRYSLHLVVDAEAIPAGMKRDVFHLRHPREPLSSANMLHVQVGGDDGQAAAGTRLVTCDALLPRRGVEDLPGYLGKVREGIMESVEELMPFVRRHLHFVDSPHDGRDAQDLIGSRLIAPDEPWSRGPQTMPMVYRYPVTRTFGVAAMPIRTPLRRLLMCSQQVVPGLGDEGDFVTAWSVARVITRSDRRKATMRKSTWTKAEL